ncbi:hypothetical protein BSKO_01337 [Bryopsis sp. KO-2023]|nr:hypothetical protein BSKO_01337 [Bryopsis sp. KO-2023]
MLKIGGNTLRRCFLLSLLKQEGAATCSTGTILQQPLVSLQDFRSYRRKAKEVTPDAEIDLSYTSPTDLLYRDSVKHQKFTQRVEDALVSGIFHDGVLRDALVKQRGFSVSEVRVAGDRRTAFIQWGCLPKMRRATQQDLFTNLKRIRTNFGERLGARFLPRLEFRFDSLTQDQRNIEDVFNELDVEDDRDKLESMTKQIREEIDQKSERDPRG